MEPNSALDALIEPTLTAMGYTLVRVRLGGERRRKLQVMAERNDGAGMTVDDCADISRALSALLDVEDPIGGAYDLEVSSPGIDRPLVKLEDYERFVGFDAKIETRQSVAGRKRHRGRLLGVAAGQIQMAAAAGDEVWEIPIDLVRDAKLLLTPELIAAELSMAKRN